METTDDRKMEEGMPGSLPVSGRPKDIDHQFHGPDVPTLLTWAFGFFGIAGVAIGALLIVPQMMIVGVILLALAVWVHFGWRNMTRHAAKRQY